MQRRIIRQLLSVWISSCLAFLSGNSELLALQNQNQLRIVVIENAGGTVGAKSGSESSIVVQVQDVNTRVSGAQVVFTAPDNGPSGSFDNGAKSVTVVTDASGNADVKSFRRNDIGGPFQLKVSASKGAATGTATVTLTNLGGGGGSKKKLIIIVAVAAAVVVAILLAGGGDKPGCPEDPSKCPPPVTVTPVPGDPTVSVGP